MAKIQGFYLIPSLILTYSVACEAQQPSKLMQTTQQIQQINHQIESLKRSLDTAHDKRRGLHQELANTEKQIGDAIHQLRQLEPQMARQQAQINQLEQKIGTLSQQLSQQQQQLAKHVRTRYQMGEYQPLKWLIDKEEPSSFSRLLTYYQYLIKSRQQLIQQINSTREDLTSNQQALEKQLAQQQSLQAQLKQQQQQLEGSKQQQRTILTALDTAIHSDQQQLVEYEHNKQNLSRLLNSLKEQNFTQSSKPFASMRKKLPSPIHAHRGPLQKMNQGVTFFAGEGEAVFAVYPGKVVFSDWLKGYGLLLIIDHGQGFMTLYAHNQSLFKRKGEFVHQNEQIASVGHTGGIKQNGLYFEVRQRGKAVSPFQWLS